MKFLQWHSEDAAKSVFLHHRFCEIRTILFYGFQNEKMATS